MSASAAAPASPAAGALVLSLSMAFANDSMIQFIRPVVKRDGRYQAIAFKPSDKLVKMLEEIIAAVNAA